MSARAEVPTGETIATKVESLKPGDNLAEIARDLTDAHAHRPGVFQKDLALVNQELHEKGFLPGFDIVGIRGQDIVTKAADGHTEIFDSTNLNFHHADTTGSSREIFGRTATLNPDGSGQIEVKAGDSTWAISKDVLRNSGIDKPTDNQIANYMKELERLNSNNLGRIHPGDTLQLPPTMQKGFDTEFNPERGEALVQQKTAEANATYDAAKAALDKFRGDNHLMGGGSNITKGEIENALTRTDLTDTERKGLEFLQTNFDKFKNIGQGFMGRGDCIWTGALDQWKVEALKLADQADLMAFQDRKGS